MRHRFLSSILAVCTAAIVLSWSSPVASAFGSRRSQVYVALGDSLAVGVGATDPARLGYVAHVFRIAHASRAGSIDHLVNLAASGETSRTFITGGQLDRAVAAIDDQASEVRLVTLDIGGNDFLGLLQAGQPCAIDPGTTQCQAAVRAALMAFPANYTAILSRLTQALTADPGDERLLVMTYYNPFSGTGNLPFERAIDAALLGSDGRIDCSALPAGDDRLGLNDLISCIGAQFGAVAVDIRPLFAGRAQVLTHINQGDTHPTNAGHAAIAHAFWKLLLRSGI